MSTRTARRLAATALVVGLLALPGIATASDTTVSFTVAASGTLAVSQGASTATLTDGGGALDFSATLPGTVTGSLPATTVSDTRGTLAGAWSVSVVATGDWENQSDTSITVGAANARAYLDATDLTDLTTNVLAGTLDGMLITSAELAAGVSNLGTSYTLLAGTTTLGNGSVTFTPAVTMTVPAGTPAGTYAAVVQQTVS